MKNYKVSVAVKTCFQLPNWHDGIFFLLQSIRASIFYGLELVLTFSFKVRNRFRIRINNVMSVGNNRGGHLGTPNSSFRWLHFCSWMSYPFIYRSVTRTHAWHALSNGHHGSVGRAQYGIMALLGGHSFHFSQLFPCKSSNANIISNIPNT